jgi:tRNA(Ile)-lysidine synthase
MFNAFKQFIQKHNLFLPEKDTLLVAVSGGIDSVVLVHLLKKINANFGIAHVNFRLRGEESELDQNFVENLAKHYNVQFHLLRCEENFQTKYPNHSIQMIARKIRYSFFEETRVKFNYHKIAVAQHQNDLLETLILNLCRGGGIASFHGILPENGYLIRPLLFATREMIAAYAKNEGIIWRDDASNSKNMYKRNFVRHEIVPKLKLLNPALEKTASLTAERVYKAEVALNVLIHDFLRKHVKKEKFTCYKLSLQSIHSNVSAEPFLCYLFKKFKLSYSQIQELSDWKNTKREAGVIVENNNIVVCLHQNSWVWRTKKNKLDPFELTPNTTVNLNWATITCSLEYQPVYIQNENQLFLDYEKIKDKKLIIRPFKPGDRINLKGLKGSKKISDLFCELKVPVIARNLVPLLEIDDKIIWILGLKKSADYFIYFKPTNSPVCTIRWQEKREPN